MADRIQATRSTPSALGIERAAAQVNTSTRSASRERGQETYRLLAEAVTANANASPTGEAADAAAAKVDRRQLAEAAQRNVKRESDKAEVTRQARPKFEAAAKRIEQFLQRLGQRLQLDHSWDKEANRGVVTVRDAQSGDVIRQIPPEETLRIARSVGYYQSALVNLQA
jgi:flagellar protein FlaG